MQNVSADKLPATSAEMASSDQGEIKASGEPQSPLPEVSQPAARGWRFWAIFIPMCVAVLLNAIESTVTSTALPRITADLEAGDLYVWVMNSFLLARFVTPRTSLVVVELTFFSTAFQPLYGQFAGIWGRRWPSIFAVAVFTLGSGLSGGASSIEMLIAGRTVQGVGGAGISLMNQLIISDLVPLRERATYVSITFAVFGFGAVLGPVIGGLISEYTSWRWVFYINLPVGGVTLILQLLFLQVTYVKRFTWQQKMKQIDWIGNFLLISSVTSILIALSWANTRYPWASYQVLVPLLVGFLGTGLFHIFEASPFCKMPIMPPLLFTDRTCFAALALVFLQSMVAYWSMFFLPIYFQGVLAVSPGRSGVLLLPSVLVAIPAALVSGRVLAVTGRYKPIHIFGSSVMIIGVGIYSTLDRDSSLAKIVIYQLVAGFGAGQLLTTTLPAAQAPISQANVAIVTSAWGFLRSYGSIWGVAIPSAIFNSRFAELYGSISNPAVRQSLSGGSAYTRANKDFILSLDPTSQDQVISVFADSLKLVWQVSIAFAALCLVLCFVEKEIELRRTHETDFGLKEKTGIVDVEKSTAGGKTEEDI